MATIAALRAVTTAVSAEPGAGGARGVGAVHAGLSVLVTPPRMDAG